MGKILVVAGEVSGDLHAARVVRELKQLAPNTEFFGMGSEALAAEGVEILVDPTEVSTIGFTEALKNLKTHLQHLAILKKAIQTQKPDLAFLVDYSGFNMLMARLAYKNKLPVVNYFSPSAWIWGRWRARWMARYQATIAAVFPMEAEVYRQVGAKVEFVGHPLVDLVKVEEDAASIYRDLELDPGRPVIGLLPGSRRQEIETLLPQFLKVAEKIQAKRPEYQFVLALAQGVSSSMVAAKAAKYKLILKIIKNSSYQLMKIADFILVASGTATLEAALLETPMIIAYQVSSSTYRLGKSLLKLEHIGLPNIIAGQEIVPELIQEDANWEKILDQADAFLNNPQLLLETKRKLAEVKEKLGGEGAVKRTAQLLLREGQRTGG